MRTRSGASVSDSSFLMASGDVASGKNTTFRFCFFRTGTAGSLMTRYPGLGINYAVFHDWDGYGRLFERKAVNVIKDTDGPTNAFREAAAFWKDYKATFTFIHFDHVDHAGHESGHVPHSSNDSPSMGLPQSLSSVITHRLSL